MTDEEIERIEALVVRASAWAASRPLVSALSAILAERKELLRRVEEAEKHEGEAIDERDAWQEYVASLAAATGCDREWSSEHDHRRCVSDAIDTLRRELAEARGKARTEAFKDVVAAIDRAKGWTDEEMRCARVVAASLEVQIKFAEQDALSTPAAKEGSEA